MSVNIAELLDRDSRPRRRHDAKTGKARRKEQINRNNAVECMAIRALKRLHPDDFAELRRQARALIDAERGPLPGDPS